MLAATVLGCSGSYAAPGGACTGYLIESEATKVWLDAGPGTLANLQDICTLGDLDAVVLTHAHPDHWLELPIVANALQWYEQRSRLPVYSNAHMAKQARDLIGPEIDVPFEWFVVEEQDTVTIGDQTWSFAATEHYIPTFAVRAEADGQSVAFSSDTGPGFSFNPMVDRDGPIDLLLIESTFLERSEHPGVLHLSAEEAGEIADRAGVGRVVLTHQAPLEDRLAHLERASTKFSGPIVLAQVGQQYPARDS